MKKLHKKSYVPSQFKYYRKKKRTFHIQKNNKRKIKSFLIRNYIYRNQKNINRYTYKQHNFIHKKFKVLNPYFKLYTRNLNPKIKQKMRIKKRFKTKKFLTLPRFKNKKKSKPLKKIRKKTLMINKKNKKIKQKNKKLRYVKKQKIIKKYNYMSALLKHKKNKTNKFKIYWLFKKLIKITGNHSFKYIITNYPRWFKRLFAKRLKSHFINYIHYSFKNTHRFYRQLKHYRRKLNKHYNKTFKNKTFLNKIKTIKNAIHNNTNPANRNLKLFVPKIKNLKKNNKQFKIFNRIHKKSKKILLLPLTKNKKSIR